ncbi:MAG TPA: hypothetical protein VEV16_06750 [Daejeonella sp.]|nr:hypothetical protein [Daejeonella sp.]
MKWILSFLICLSLYLPASGQTPYRHSQQIESVKIAFITQQLNLSNDEAEKFWPIYNNYQKELNELLKQKRENRIKNKANATEELDNELDFEGRLLDIRKKYKAEFSKVLPADKVLQFFKAEREFREQMIRQLKERQKNP